MWWCWAASAPCANSAGAKTPVSAAHALVVLMIVVLVGLGSLPPAPPPIGAADVGKSGFCSRRAVRPREAGQDQRARGRPQKAAEIAPFHMAARVGAPLRRCGPPAPP